MVSGPLFSVEFCSLTEYPRGERVEIYGSDGTMIIDQVLDPPMVLYRNDRDLSGTPVAGIPTTFTGGKQSRSRHRPDFVEAVRTRTGARRNQENPSTSSPGRSGRMSRWRRWAEIVPATPARTWVPAIMSIALALGASLGWGIADFTAGIRAGRPRRSSSYGLPVDRPRARRGPRRARRSDRASRPAGGPHLRDSRGFGDDRRDSGALPRDGRRRDGVAAPIAATGWSFPVGVGLAGGDTSFRHCRGRPRGAAALIGVTFARATRTRTARRRDDRRRGRTALVAALGGGLARRRSRGELRRRALGVADPASDAGALALTRSRRRGARASARSASPPSSRSVSSTRSRPASSPSRRSTARSASSRSSEPLPDRHGPARLSRCSRSGSPSTRGSAWSPRWGGGRDSGWMRA